MENNEFTNQELNLITDFLEPFLSDPYLGGTNQLILESIFRKINEKLKENA